MDFTLLISTFVTVFLAELGDKTQLATVAISGTSNRPLAVFLGSSSALVLASLIGAVAGGSLSAVIPADWLQLIASTGFPVKVPMSGSSLSFMARPASQSLGPDLSHQHSKPLSSLLWRLQVKPDGAL